MKLPFNKIMNYSEWITVPIGGLALILSLFGVDSVYLTLFAGILCIVYILYVGYLWILRPKFDWHLIHGHFLLKVVAFVILVPSFITSGFIISKYISDSEYSPKNLVYEENLYTNDGSEIDSLSITKYDLFAEPAFLNAHNFKLICDSILIQKNKLPETIVSKQEDPSIFWTVYYHFIDPGNQHMTTSKSGRGWSALIAIMGVFLLNGLLVSSIIGWIDSRKEKWLKGEVKYPCFLRKKKHYVIIGGNDMAISIVKQIFTPQSQETKSSPVPYVIIQTSRNVEEFRRELFSELTDYQQQHVIIFYGSRTSKGDLEKLCLHNAEEVYILGELTRVDELEPYHDSINMQCLDCIQEIRTENKVSKVVTCYVMFDYQTTFAAFQASKQKREIDGDIIFIPFNIHETWAQKILVNGEAFTLDGENIKYNNIDKDGIDATSENFVHIIIVGMSKIGTALAIEAAHVAHFPNYIYNSKRRTRITFIDSNARKEADFFMGRFSDLFKLCKWTDVDGKTHNEGFPGDIMSKFGECPKKNEYSYFNQNFIDIEFEFREGGVETDANRDYLRKSVEDRNAIVTVAVCLPQSHQSIAAALYLPHDVIEKANDIWVYQPQSSKLIFDITKQQKNPKYWQEVKYKKLKPFGMQYGGFDEKLINNKLVTYCQCFYDLKEEIKKRSPQYNEWTCDMISQEYEDNPNIQLDKSITIWSIWSNIYHLNTLNYKLRSITKENEDLTTQVESNKELIARVEHNRWNVEKLLMGYRPLRDRLIEDDEEINHIVEFLSFPDEDSMIKKIKSGSKNERDIYKFVGSVKKFYSDGPQKIHPNICPYEDTFLPERDKEYDICFTLAMPFLREKMKKKS